MRSHVLRPLYVAAALLTILLLVRSHVVARDFGIGERGYMYGWHRKGNEAEWKAVEPKFKPRDYCNDCHTTEHSSISQFPHSVINCQNCHGPAGNHPVDPPKLTINRDRTLCLRCHAQLSYPSGGRSYIKGIDPAQHNPGAPCASCHNPHKPIVGGIK